MVRRKAAFEFLLADSESIETSGSKEMSSHELEMLVSISDPTSPDSVKFWATAAVVQVLSEWGVATSVWLHGCMCYHHKNDKERKGCHLKGRRAVELASGAWKTFRDDLEHLSLSTTALQALSTLQTTSKDVDYHDFLVNSFQECKAMMTFRSFQAWSWWSSLPFTVLQMGLHFVDMNVPEDTSRNKAKELMKLYDDSADKTSLGVVSWMFFGHDTNRQYIQKWIRGKRLHEDLVYLLLGYSTALVVMQRLEGRHHLVNIAVARGRAQKPSAVAANLRRRMNRDLTHPDFKKLLPELLNSFETLIPQKWSSKGELLRIIYGYGLDELHPDLQFEEQQMARHAALTDQLHQASAPPSRLVARFNMK